MSSNLGSSNIVATEIVVVPTDSSYRLPNDWSISSIVSTYSASIPGLASMQASERTEVRAEGTVKIVTFTQRSGQKG